VAWELVVGKRERKKAVKKPLGKTEKERINLVLGEEGQRRKEWAHW